MNIADNLSQSLYLGIDLELVENPISDKRLLKLIQQCRTKQVLDYVKKNGDDTSKSANNQKSNSNKTPSKSSRADSDNVETGHRIIIKPHLGDELTVFWLFL